ncbi:hypothetical protein BRARA_A01502 [Brassica rapa]|uniref:SWIM-type domain-containing protein n=1 Tax=Brassica campestris TaxID=3711 RepID=A0A398ATZ0_BRACM|nr:hypothetical protein BRARA_A01502 [Brassica rapa]
MSYWLNDGESEMVGLVADPVEIATDKDFRIFKALHRADKSVNLFVTLRESVGGEMIFLRSERVIRVQMNAPVRPPDEDVAFLMKVQQIEERNKRNSQSGGMVATSKDQDKSGETLDDGSGANSQNCEQEKGNVCGDDLAVDNRENKEGKVEEGDAVKTASDNLAQQICLIKDTRTLSVEQVSVANRNNGGAHEDVAAEDEGDDSDYDYNGWHDYCRNDCVTDDDDDFVEGPGKGRSCGQSGGKGIRRPGGIGGTGAAKSACGKKQRSRGGGYISNNNDSSVEITDLARDLGSPSRLDTEVTETEVGVDVVLVTPPQSKNKHTRVTEDNDDNPVAFQGEEVLTKAGDNVSGTPTDVGQVQGGEAFMKGIQVPDMYGYNDVDGVYNEKDESSCNPLDIDFSKEDSDIYVGRTFKHKAECKLTLAIYAIAKVYTFNLRHCKCRLTAKCYEKECKWRVVAVQLGDSPTYLVKKAILNHVCVADIRGKYKKHGTAKVLAALLRSKYERLYSGPRAMELPEMLRTEFNYTCSYWKAWKAKELAIASAQGTEEDSYKMLPQYFYVLKLANPGTITDIKTEKDKEGNTRFKYAFMSLKACIDGWKHLRKVLVVDGTHMFGKYKGVLLSASGQDANSRVFPIAFAVVESENTEFWTWFFERLSTIVEDGSDLSIISDRCAAVFAAKDKWYPRAHHGICLVNLQRNVNDKFKGLQQKAMEIMELIKLTDWRCWDYLEKIDKKLWTRSHFEGERFNVMTSNAAESLNNALLPARDSPIMALFEFIRRKLCTWYVSRRTEISKMKGNVPDNIHKILVEQLVLSTGLLVMPCLTWLFEVTHRPTNFGFTVDLDKRTCTCLEFQKLSLPCRHAIAAASCRNMQYTMFVCKHHLKETWAETVRGIILPVPDPKNVEVPAEILTVDLYPPTTKQTKGRLGIKRKLSAGEIPGGSKKHKPNKCSNCFKEGHLKTTCKEVKP